MKQASDTRNLVQSTSLPARGAWIEITFSVSTCGYNTNLMAMDPELQAKLKAVQNGSTNYSDALDYADRVSQMLLQALDQHLTPGALPDDTLYYNIAKRLVNQVFGEAYDLGVAAAVQVQKAINQASGLGLAVVTDKSKRSEELNTLINTVSGKKIDETDGKKIFEAAKKVALNGASDTMEANANFQGGAGLKPRIIRKATFGCCILCSPLAGTYYYPNVPHDVYRRHENCRCTVEYDPGTGRRQNVHTKQWSSTGQSGTATVGTAKSGKSVLRSGTKNDTIKTKYAPSPQRAKKGLQVSAKKYAILTGTLNTRYPNLMPEDGTVSIYDSKYCYLVEADGFGGLYIRNRTRLGGSK